MDRKFFTVLGRGAALAAGLAAATAATPRPAQACGGFFCSAASPVNQAAEQIIFVDNGDDTVTAVIQILYEGPAERFAWVLPVSGVPDVAVSSDQALDALKQFTNPTYQLNTTFGGTCGGPMFGNGASGSAGSFAPPTADGGDPSVSVQASGAIGPYDYAVISVTPETTDPAEAAITWLADNDYDIGDLGEEVLSPYLEDGLNLIAFRLTKGNSTGAIRPVMLTYASALPSIPILPTAVAANDDMGVMVWALSDARAIPENYKALELNEALLDWFNPMNNYNEVVTRAADEAMGQGFVTEYAQPMTSLTNSGFAVFADWQEQTWNDFMARAHTDPMQMIQEAGQNWNGWDGMDEALQGAVTLPETISLEDFKLCTACYINNEGVTFDTIAYLTGLFELVIKPMMDTQALLESRPYITRLYTTMSADEMTLDPVFAFNPDLDDVSNFHTADQVIECDEDSQDLFSGPWRVQLPQGTTVRGTEQRVWPIEIDAMPAALRILQYGTSGDGLVLEDYTDTVDMMASGGMPMSGGEAGSGSVGSAGRGGSAGTGGGEDDDPAPTGNDDEPEGSDPNDGLNASSGGGCSATGAMPAQGFGWLTLALAGLVRRRRTQRS